MTFSRWVLLVFSTVNFRLSLSMTCSVIGRFSFVFCHMIKNKNLNFTQLDKIGSGKKLKIFGSISVLKLFSGRIFKVKLGLLILKTTFKLLLVLDVTTNGSLSWRRIHVVFFQPVLLLNQSTRNNSFTACFKLCPWAFWLFWRGSSPSVFGLCRFFYVALPIIHNKFAASHLDPLFVLPQRPIAKCFIATTLA